LVVFVCDVMLPKSVPCCLKRGRRGIPSVEYLCGFGDSRSLSQGSLHRSDGKRHIVSLSVYPTILKIRIRANASDANDASDASDVVALVIYAPRRNQGCE
jgi:hypothetical protein